MAAMTKVAGFYDLTGYIAEVVAIDGRFVIRFESVPDRFAPTLTPTGDNSFVVETGNMAGAEISFNESGGVIGGIVPIERIERSDPPPWPTGKGSYPGRAGSHARGRGRLPATVGGDSKTIRWRVDHLGPALAPPSVCRMAHPSSSSDLPWITSWRPRSLCPSPGLDRTLRSWRS